jgi:hypothetical protein
VVVNGIGGGGWTVLLSRGWLQWTSAWLRRAFLSLQLMRLVVVVVVSVSGQSWGLLELASGGLMMRLVVVVLSSSSSPMCVLSLVGL